MLTVDAISERLTFDVGHHLEQEIVGLARIEQRKDVRMRQVGGGRDLGQEPLGSHYRCEFGLQGLERDLTLVLQAVGQVDDGHAALTKLTFNGVAAFEGSVQAGDAVTHAGKMLRWSAKREGIRYLIGQGRARM